MSDLDGKYIKDAYLPSMEYGNVSILRGLSSTINPKYQDCKLRYHSEYCGDHSENWVVILKNNFEIARYNTQFISLIEWEEEK